MTDPLAKVAIAHDYLTQRGGAERVVLAMLRAFPNASVYTSVYVPDETYPEFVEVDVRPTWLGRIPIFRHDHRLALPFLAQAFSSCVVDADVVICSSSGWAHGVSTRGQKLVYCYTPARWLYQSDKYLGGASYRGAGPVMALMRPLLIRWDRRHAQSAARYLTSSTSVRERIKRIYGIDAEIVPPPLTSQLGGPQTEVTGLEPGFLLCVSRLLAYKNVDAVIRAASHLSGRRLVVVGDGPDRTKLALMADARTTMIRQASDQELNWLYANCAGVIAAGYEDFGLTPIEAASFGKPSAVLRWGGYTDTVRAGRTGVFFEAPTPEGIAAAMTELLNHRWDHTVLVSHAGAYSEGAFVDRLRVEVELLAENVQKRDRSRHATRTE